MKVIITNRFKKKYFKVLKKQFSLDEFVIQLKKKSHTFIELQSMFLKYKGAVKAIHIRGVVFVLEDSYIVPLCFFLKKDKQYGNNVSWHTHEDLILEEYEKSLDDIESGDFDIFD